MWAPSVRVVMPGSGTGTDTSGDLLLARTAFFGSDSGAGATICGAWLRSELCVFALHNSGHYVH